MATFLKCDMCGEEFEADPRKAKIYGGGMAAYQPCPARDCGYGVRVPAGVLTAPEPVEAPAAAASEWKSATITLPAPVCGRCSEPIATPAEAWVISDAVIVHRACVEAGDAAPGRYMVTPAMRDDPAFMADLKASGVEFVEVALPAVEPEPERFRVYVTHSIGRNLDAGAQAPLRDMTVQIAEVDSHREAKRLASKVAALTDHGTAAILITDSDAMIVERLLATGGMSETERRYATQ